MFLHWDIFTQGLRRYIDWMLRIVGQLAIRQSSSAPHNPVVFINPQIRFRFLEFFLSGGRLTDLLADNPEFACSLQFPGFGFSTNGGFCGEPQHIGRHTQQFLEVKEMFQVDQFVQFQNQIRSN